MRFILRVLVNAAALGIATWLFSGITLSGHDTTQKVVTILIVALIFGIVNAIVKPHLRPGHPARSCCSPSACSCW